MAGVTDQIVLITGAASGIGRETALLLAANGARIAVADVDAQGGRETVGRIEAAGGEAALLGLDVTREADWAAAIDAVIGRFGRLDVLVNSAGIELVKAIADTSFEEWRRVLAVNLDGVFLGTKAAIAAMAARGGGSIVNISSVAGINGFSRQAAYCASKGGVRLLSKAAAVECAEANLNVRVNSVHPGVIDTPMSRAVYDGLDDEQRARMEAYIDGLHPLGHVGEAADVAHCVLFLASDASKFMTGSEMVVNGGLTAR